MTKRRKVIVHIATSADGYIARSDGDLEWLTSRPAPEGFYGMNAFVKSIDTKVLGRRTYEESVRLWLMGGGEIIGSFLDEQAIDELVISVVTATCPWTCTPSNGSKMVWFSCTTR